MKKIIAISVMLALIAGAVFAETSVSGGVETRFSIAKQTADKFDSDGDGTLDKTPDPVMGGSIGNAEIKLSGANDEGTLGGTFRLRAQALAGGDDYNQVFVWWKPVEMVKIWLGVDADGMFDTGDFMCWGFHQGDNDYIFNHDWYNWRQIFPGNFDAFGLALSFYPIEGLDINLALPSGAGWPNTYTNAGVTNTRPITDPSGDTTNSGMLPGHLRFVGNYSFSAGKISFVYLGAGQGGGKNGSIGASFLLTAIENIQVKVGGNIITNDPDMTINAGFGVTWSGDGYGVRFRVGATDLTAKAPNKPTIVVNALPYLKVGESGEALLDISITNKDKMGWSVVPAYRLNINGGAFKIGLQVYNNVSFGGSQFSLSGEEYIKWNVPMLLAFNF